VGVTQAPTKLILVAQDTGKFDLLKAQPEPVSVSNGFFNALSMIYKMEMLDNDL